MRNALYRRLVIGLLLITISSSYLFLSIARKEPPPGSDNTRELYALLARGFAQGKTSLPIKPKPELLSLPDPYDPEANVNYRLHDASLYKGQYYLYFGPVPAITLFLPYHILTGRDLPNRAAVAVFCVGGFLGSCALFFSLASHNRWVLPFWLQCAVVLLLGSMSLVYLILRRPSFYEVAIAGGYCFATSGFLVLAKALLMGGAVGKRVLFAGVLFGFAVGCRPHLVVICAIVLGMLAIWARNLRFVIAMTAGMAACGIALGWYNYTRFDNPIEFGRTYQLSTFSLNPASSYHGLEFSLQTTFLSAAEFLLLPPHVDAKLPYIHTVFINPLLGHPGPPIWTEDMVGLLPAAPIALLGFFLPVFLGRRFTSGGLLDRASTCLLYAIYWSGLAVFLLLCVVGWVLGRYLVDFAPLLTFLGVSVTAMLWQKVSQLKSRHVFSCVVNTAAIYGAVTNVALAIPGLDAILKFLGR